MSDVPRDRYGRYLIFPTDKKQTKPTAWTRATTLAKTLDDPTALTDWKLRTALVGLTLRPDLHQLVASHRDDKATLKRAAQDALDAGNTAQAATHGTSLHRWAELADLGKLDPADPAAPHDRIRTYRQACAAAGLEILPDLIERIVTVPQVHGHNLDVAGTFDRIVKVPDGRLMVADLKTGSWVGGLEWATQLALYGNAETIYTPTEWGGQHEPMPDVDKTTALVIHLPQDTNPPECTIYTVDIAAGWAAVKTALDVRAWRREGRKLVGTPDWADNPALPDPDGHARVLARIERIKAHEPAFLNMLAVWPADVPTPKRVDIWTGAQTATLDRLLADIEAVHEVAF